MPPEPPRKETPGCSSRALPERVHGVVLLLMAEISSRYRLLIQLAALSGKAFELGAVAEPVGQPAGMLLPLVEEATDVGVIAGVGDRLVFTQPLLWQAVPPRAPRPSSPQIATHINRWPRTVSYHLRKMFGTLSVRSRSELAGTVGPRLREAP
ncbi:hypothetical protein [Streptomyces mirabilis]